MTEETNTATTEQEVALVDELKQLVGYEVEE